MLSSLLETDNYLKIIKIITQRILNQFNMSVFLVVRQNFINHREQFPFDNFVSICFDYKLTWIQGLFPLAACLLVKLQGYFISKASSHYQHREQYNQIIEMQFWCQCLINYPATFVNENVRMCTAYMINFMQNGFSEQLLFSVS